MVNPSDSCNSARLCSLAPAIGIGCFNVEDSDFAVERADVDTEVAGRPFSISGVSLERFGDEEFFQGVEVHGHPVLQSMFGGRTQFRGKVTEFDHASATEYEGLFDDVLQLADVSRIFVIHQAGQDGIGNASNVLALKSVELGDEVVNQKWDILAPGR